MFRAICLSLYLVLSAPALANSLFNPANGKLFVPYITLGESVVSAELQLSSGVFQIADVRVRQSDLAPAYGQNAVFTLDGHLFLPRVELDGQFYQLGLAYRTETEDLAIDLLKPASNAQAGRGMLLSATLLGEYSQSQLSQFLNVLFLSSGISANLPVQNGITLYKLSYQTVDPAGEMIPASALLALPGGVDSARPLVAIQHETRVQDSKAPTVSGYDIPSFALAATGYVAVTADYLGFGDSAGLHLFNQASSLAKTVVDALRAGKQATQDKGLTLNGQVFLVGYSEGGYATLALQRELETHHADEFSITASAPLAGAYDLSGTMIQRLLDSSSYSNPYYFAYISLGLQQIYGAFDGLDMLFAAPYAADIMAYFNGQYSSSQINVFLPRSHQTMFTAQVIADLNNPDSWLFAALRSNDLLRWKPNAPTRLYHCTQDEQVPFANSQTAYDSFQALGATQVELIPVDYGSHSACAVPIMLMVKEWFDSLL